MRILYGAPASVFVRKPRILLQEKKLEFYSEAINPMLGVSEVYKSISPLGKIPAFEDEGFVVADSSAICAYLDAKYPAPSFYPKKPQDLAHALWFEEYADTALFKAVAACYYQMVLVPLYRQAEPDLKAINHALTQLLPPVADYLEREIQGKDYFVGNQFSIADVAVVSVFLNMYYAGFPLPKRKWPELTRYLELQFGRPSVVVSTQDLKVEVERAKVVIASLVE